MRKSTAIIVLLLLCNKILLAQLSYNYTGYSIGAGGGLARAYADLAGHLNKQAFFVNFNYNYTPYTTFTAELQAGTLASGSPLTDKDTRAFKNNFKAVVFYADLQAGEYIDYRYSTFSNIIKNIYVGSGFGVVHNKMAFIQRTSLNNPGYVFPGQDASTELMLPLRIGYEFKFFNFYEEPQVRLNIGYQMSWVYGEGLDGYNDPQKMFKNNYVDRYSLISIGIKYGFGTPVSYKKPIRF